MGSTGCLGAGCFVREVQAATGGYGSVQRFDAVAIGLVPSNKYARVVYEVKISRGDWLRELRPQAEYISNGFRRRSDAARRLAAKVQEGIIELLPHEEDPVASQVGRGARGQHGVLRRRPPALRSARGAAARGRLH